MHIPVELLSLITDFAWCKDYYAIKHDLCTLIKIQRMDLNPLLIQKWFWYNEGLCRVCTPLLEFNPLHELSAYTFIWYSSAAKSHCSKGVAALFRWSLIDKVLHRLDFRKKAVRIFGTRRLWDARFERDLFTSIQLFDKFLVFVLTNQSKVIKKRYRYVGLL